MWRGLLKRTRSAAPSIADQVRVRVLRWFPAADWSSPMTCVRCLPGRTAAFLRIHRYALRRKIRLGGSISCAIVLGRSMSGLSSISAEGSRRGDVSSWPGTAPQGSPDKRQLNARKQTTPAMPKRTAPARGGVAAARGRMPSETTRTVTLRHSGHSLDFAGQEPGLRQ